jgi:hypothetical protein
MGVKASKQTDSGGSAATYTQRADQLNDMNGAESSERQAWRLAGARLLKLAVGRWAGPADRGLLAAMRWEMVSAPRRQSAWEITRRGRQYYGCKQ